MANTKTKKDQEVDSTKVKDEENAPADASGDEEVKQVVAKVVDPSQYVIVRNGYQGKLFYKSSRTGESFKWEEFGGEQEITLRDLKSAKNSHKKYFINNWFMFDEDWIIDYLGVKQYYKNALKIDRFDDVFKKTPTEIKKTIAKLSDGQKKSVAYRARVLIENKEIDSLNAIAALEEALGVELIEK